MHFENTLEHNRLADSLKRDICMLYHELSAYNHIMGDLDYDGLYTLPYWEFLVNAGLDWEVDAFIREGCLVMLLAMSLDCVDGSGTYLKPYLKTALESVRTFGDTDRQTKRLLNVVEQALCIASSDQQTDRQFKSETRWVYKTFVKGYFIRSARRFQGLSEETDTNHRRL